MGKMVFDQVEGFFFFSFLASDKPKENNPPWSMFEKLSSKKYLPILGYSKHFLRPCAKLKG